MNKCRVVDRVTVHLRLAPAAGLLILLALLSMPSTAQTGDYTAPRTVDGKADLQGMWTNNTITPLERPTQFANKAFLSEQEQQEMEREVAQRSALADLPSDPNRPPPTKGQIDLEDSYNNFWFDDGTTVAIYNGERRTSLIVDPANGRIPAFTEAAQQRLAAAAQARSQAPRIAPACRALPTLFWFELWSAHASDSVQQPLSDCAIARLCHDTCRNGARCAYHTHRRRPATRGTRALAR